MGREEVGDTVAGCALLATLLEVSAYPKPGNVHRTRDMPGTRYEHFLAGGVALGPAVRSLAVRGFDVEEAGAPYEGIGVGAQILRAVRGALSWQRGGNVNLGAILLLAPLAAAAGASLKGGGVDASELRGFLRRVTASTTPEDAVAVYDAIRLAAPGRVLGRVGELDVLDDASRGRILREGLSLLDVFGMCSDADSICREWTTGFETTFEVGHPHLRRRVEAEGDLNAAVVDTFLLILSNHPDSLIRRKSGLEEAVEVSRNSGRILEAGGASSERGRAMLWELDRRLHEAGGALNPGTSADLTSASIFILLFEGWRP